MKKIDLIATCLRQMTADERAIGTRFLAGEVPQKTGIGYALIHETQQAGVAGAPYLSLSEVDRRLTAIAELRGAGSAGARKDQLN
ncbi:MAG TPA: hypothetical protein VGC41_07335, partial [Kofleriaceae bacterium]